MAKIALRIFVLLASMFSRKDFSLAIGQANLGTAAQGVDRRKLRVALGEDCTY